MKSSVSTKSVISVALGMWAVLSGCQPQRKASDGGALSPLVAATAERSSKIVLDELRELTYERRCSGIQDCAMLALGSDGCGEIPNPVLFIAYAPRLLDMDLLNEKVAEYNTLQLQEMQSEPPPTPEQCAMYSGEPKLVCARATSTCEIGTVLGNASAN